MGKLSAALLIVAIATLCVGAATAGDFQIYKWVDNQGVVHYSDKAPAQTQPAVTRMTLADFPPLDPKAEAADQAWIASIRQWYQDVLTQQSQLQYQQFLAWEQSQPTSVPAPATQEPARVIPVCWQCDRFHFRHHYRQPLRKPPTPQSLHASLWMQPNPFTQ